MSLPGQFGTSRMAVSRGVAPVGYAAAALLALGVGVLVSTAPRLAVGGLVTAAAVPAWLWLAKRSSFLLAAALPVLCVGLLGPRSMTVLAELCLVAFLAVSTLRAALDGDRRWIVGAACLAVPATWLLLTLNPNVPDIETGLLGLRKASLAFVALGAGALWPATTRRLAPELVVGLLTLGSAMSLLLHFGLPGVESGFARSADVYTSFFRGSTRMQGLWAGPFHVALAGTFLTIAAWHIWLTRARKIPPSAVLFALLGLPMIFAANVRTAFLAVAFAFAATLLLRAPRTANPLRRWLGTAVLAISALGLVMTGLIDNSALSSIGQLGNDGRALTRLDRWSDALSLFGSSPLVGNGAGSAGATLQNAFYNGLHVTTDNAFLVPLVEGGLLGVAAMALAMFAVARRSDGLLNLAHPSAAALLALTVFALTGNILEASPVSVFLMIIIGLRVPPRTNEAAP